MPAIIEVRESQLSVFYRQLDVSKVSTAAIANSTKMGYLPPVEGKAADGSDSRILLLPSDAGNGHIIVTEETTTLLIRHPAATAKNPQGAKQNLIDRASYLFKIFGAMGIESEDFTYAGAVASIVLPSTVDSKDVNQVLISRFGMQGVDGASDIGVSFTNQIDDQRHVLCQILAFKRFEIGAGSNTQTRLHPDDAVERGIQLTVDFNSRLGYNLGDNPTIDRNTVESLIVGAYATGLDIANSILKEM